MTTEPALDLELTRFANRVVDKLKQEIDIKDLCKLIFHDLDKLTELYGEAGENGFYALRDIYSLGSRTISHGPYRGSYAGFEIEGMCRRGFLADRSLGFLTWDVRCELFRQLESDLKNPYSEPINLDTGIYIYPTSGGTFCKYIYATGEAILKKIK
jgi:hypothetical protein